MIVALVLIMSGSLAAFFPARRAANVNPMEALRAEWNAFAWFGVGYPMSTWRKKTIRGLGRKPARRVHGLCFEAATVAAISSAKLILRYFLLSPDDAGSHKDQQTIRIPIAQAGNASVDCSIRGSWFSFGRSSEKQGYWRADTPSAASWEASEGAVDMKEEWRSFEKALYELQQKQCFSSVDEYLRVKQRIATSLSAPVEDTLFYRYSYGPGGYIDMAP